jgi:hypothetical protein
MSEEIKRYVAERDRMLMQCDVDVMLEFMRQHNIPGPSNRETAEIMLHKTRTSATTLPMAERAKSKRWLVERGYRPHDDGDVPLP